MSLINKRSVTVIGAAALAIFLPMKLLESDKHKFTFPIALPPMEIGEPNPATLAFALASPPFDPDRNPNTSEAPALAAAPGTEQAPAAPAPALVGVVTSRRGRGVALAKTAAGETLTLAPGESADGWSLVSVDRDSAVFQRGAERHTARLDFGNKVPVGNFAPTPTTPPTSEQVALPQANPPVTGAPADRKIR